MTMNGQLNPLTPLPTDPPVAMVAVSTTVMKGHDEAGQARVILRVADTNSIQVFAMSPEHALDLSTHLANASRGGILIARDTPPPPPDTPT
jgi:hypothetical protein